VLLGLGLVVRADVMAPRRRFPVVEQRFDCAARSASSSAIGTHGCDRVRGQRLRGLCDLRQKVLRWQGMHRRNRQRRLGPEFGKLLA
jgi:hypothetical protein